jgi:tRNA-modifying protein YgfZ
MGDRCSPVHKHHDTGTMTQANAALLTDRGVVRVSGADAGKLLQGIVTGDIDLLTNQPALHAALLSPQGKILFEFFVVRGAGGFLLETARDQAANLAKRLTMYKLRANVDIVDASADHGVLAGQGAAPQVHETTQFSDPRLPALGWRALVDAKSATGSNAGASDRYHAHRIALGVPEGGKDYAFGDAFPHEANFDLLNGVSFTKGCFVGQEVVSRMQHRGTARKRVVIVEAESPLQTGSDVLLGEAAIGTVGSVSGTRALALLRLDRAEEAQRKGATLTAGGEPISVRLPEYLAAAAAPSTP